MSKQETELSAIFAKRAAANSSYPAHLTTNNNPQTIEAFGNLGATTLEIAWHLNGRGQIYLFDYEYNVNLVADLLKSEGFENVERYGSSTKLLDSYNWTNVPSGKWLELGVAHSPET
jgi:hypothetical protein